ncbi:Uncharacterised protein [Leminorella richardii]|uniref:Uncharacterized protein n=1 Tax=Leminorella richardii TaxID=158841 RepID=A0A2X4U5N8_9GAMM|nr:hypothetical protein [Leminorella richardii]SQI34311.1 Uncharacterised protein [Leminorella richardii]
MSDDIFDFDIDAELEEAEKKVAQKASESPEQVFDEGDCEGCKI